MTETSVISQRPDIDIQADIDHLIAHYPPLQKDRKSVRYEVTDGVVTVSGHVQTPSTKRYFLDRLPNVQGIKAVHADGLFDDETIRIEAGKIIPVGVVLGKVFYGTLVLAGQLPEGVTEESLASQVGAVPGVQRVVTDFNS